MPVRLTRHPSPDKTHTYRGRSGHFAAALQSKYGASHRRRCDAGLGGSSDFLPCRIEDDTARGHGHACLWWWERADEQWKAPSESLVLSTCRRIGPDVYLLTYTLGQAQRVTRRSTLWQHMPGQWNVLYHQGTIVVDTQLRH